MLLLYTPLELLHLDFINIHDNKLWQYVFLQLLGLNFKETVTCHGHDDVLSVFFSKLSNRFEIFYELN